MATRKQEFETVIIDPRLPERCLISGFELGRQLLQFSTAALPTNAIDQTTSRYGREPRCGIVWTSIDWPSKEGFFYRVLKTVLGEFEVAGGSGKGGNDTTGMLAIDLGGHRHIFAPGWDDMTSRTEMSNCRRADRHQGDDNRGFKTNKGSRQARRIS